MPIYEDENHTREELDKLKKNNKCKVCGERLDLFLDRDYKVFLACRNWSTSHHEGIEREYQPQDTDSQSDLRRLVEMEQKVGLETTRALAKLPAHGQLSQPQAEHILSLVYPGVPKDEVIRCAILCRDFGLHPLMKEVYIIGFENKKTGKKDYETVIGIAASRKMAADKKGAYSFIDGTPRAAKPEEIIKQFGKDSEEEKDNLISICKLRGEKGNEAEGFGLWPTGKTPYGVDKGNTKRNMANIRSERQGLSRLPGEALPQLEVVDEAYVEIPSVGKVIEKTGEILEDDELPEPTPGAIERIAKATEPEATPDLPFDSDWLTESLKTVKWSDNTVKSYLKNVYQVDPEGTVIEVVTRLNKEQMEQFFSEIQKRLDKPLG